MPAQQVTTWYLEYQGEVKSLPEWPLQVSLQPILQPNADFSQYLFCAVGHHWHWFSRLQWDYSQWQAYLQSNAVKTWVLYSHGAPAGFVELRKDPEQGVELKFFGLLPAFVGQGLGAKLLQAAIALAQQWQGTRIWVHTCSEDHPRALQTYQKAGFVITDTQVELEQMPEDYVQWAMAEPFIRSRIAFYQNKP